MIGKKRTLGRQGGILKHKFFHFVNDVRCKKIQLQLIFYLNCIRKANSFSYRLYHKIFVFITRYLLVNYY